VTISKSPEARAARPRSSNPRGRTIAGSPRRPGPKCRRDRDPRGRARCPTDPASRPASHGRSHSLLRRRPVPQGRAPPGRSRRPTRPE
jgi:hypothetical protein